MPIRPLLVLLRSLLALMVETQAIPKPSIFSEAKIRKGRKEAILRSAACDLFSQEWNPECGTAD